MKLMTFCVAMHKEIHLDLTSQRSTLNRVHLNQMLTLPLWDQLPTSGESLHYCQSMRRRQHEMAQLFLPRTESLAQWASENRTSVLLLDTYLPLAAKAFTIDMISLLRSQTVPVIWALRSEGYWDRPFNLMDLVQVLVVQAMQVGAGHTLESSFPVTVEALREASCLADWVNILDRLLTTSPHTFIVLDAELVSHATSSNRGIAQSLIESLRRQLTCSAKIFATTSCLSRGYVEELSTSSNCIMLQSDGVRDWRKPRRPKHLTRSFRCRK